MPTSLQAGSGVCGRKHVTLSMTHVGSAARTLGASHSGLRSGLRRPDVVPSRRVPAPCSAIATPFSDVGTGEVAKEKAPVANGHSNGNGNGVKLSETAAAFAAFLRSGGKHLPPGALPGTHVALFVDFYNNYEGTVILILSYPFPLSLYGLWGS
jgi:hypothetical protein